MNNAKRMDGSNGGRIVAGRGRVVFVKRSPLGSRDAVSISASLPSPCALASRRRGTGERRYENGGDLNRISGDHGEAGIISQAPKIVESKSN